jgi:hypothetical protein
MRRSPMVLIGRDGVRRGSKVLNKCALTKPPNLILVREQPIRESLMSASGYKRTYSGQLANVCFTPNSGRKWLCRGMSAFDPKRT